MSKIIEAVFDGTVFCPIEPPSLDPNSRVWIVVETKPPVPETPASFLRTARSLDLDGPPDWSANLEHYLYGDKTKNED